MRKSRAKLRKELKALAVPVMQTGSRASNTTIDNDDDLICIDLCDSDRTEEQADVNHNGTPQEVKREPIKSEIKQEPNIEPEIETGRRPSRRAARVAAKKISNHVRSYGVNDDDPNDFTTSAAPPQKPPSSSHPYSRPKQKKAVQNDLEMECRDEFLSPIQAEFLLKAQLQYNITMKSLRQLMTTSVKVFQTEPDGSIVPLTYAPDISLKTGFVSSNTKSSKTKRNRSKRSSRSKPSAASSAKSSNKPSQVASIFIT